jgi:ubiquinone/menaquinone biosynthesis C-methylase UbiE/DNA-binding transcriptional ArsR family regulator
MLTSMPPSAATTGRAPGDDPVHSPTVDADRMLDLLRAIGEVTRLRVVALLRDAELTVSDLTEILGQSQPRVSRHLRLLAEAGIVHRHREGSWVFFRLVDERPVLDLVEAVLAGLRPDDEVISADRERLAVVRAQRADEAHRYFETIAPIWDQERSLHAPEATVEAAIVEALGDAPIGRLVDLGTGTGRMLTLLGPRAERAIGLDASHSMLRVARANLDDARLDTDMRCEFRQGDVYSPPLERDGYDTVVVHQVLHYLDDPARALAEAARLLAPGGRLLVVDFAPHGHEFLRKDQAHRRLGFAPDQLAGWLDQVGLDCTTIRDIDPPAGTDGLTVTLWLATDRRPPAPSEEVAA